MPPKRKTTDVSPAAKKQKATPKVEDTWSSAISELPPSEEGFKIVSWNVNGLRALLKKPNLLQSYVTKENPDVLCLNETKLDDTVVDQMADILPGYHAYWNCATKKGYSGVAIFSKQKPITTIKGIDLAEHDDEGRVLTAEYPDLFVVSSYVPNSGQKLDRLEYRTKSWDPAMQAFIAELEAKKPVVWTGDLNVAHLDCDIHDPKTNRNKSPGFCDAERENFGKLLDGGLVDAWRAVHGEEAEGYTYWGYRFNCKAKNKGWRLDYCLLSAALRPRLQDAWRRREIPGSDHVPIGVVLKPADCAAEAVDGGGGEGGAAPGSEENTTA